MFVLLQLFVPLTLGILNLCVTYKIYYASTHSLGKSITSVASSCHQRDNRVCLELPLDLAESDSGFPSTVTYCNSSLQC